MIFGLLLISYLVIFLMSNKKGVRQNLSSYGLTPAGACPPSRRGRRGPATYKAGGVRSTVLRDEGNIVDLRKKIGLVKSFAGSQGRLFKRAPGRRRQ